MILVKSYIDESSGFLKRDGKLTFKTHTSFEGVLI